MRRRRTVPRLYPDQLSGYTYPAKSLILLIKAARFELATRSAVVGESSPAAVKTLRDQFGLAEGVKLVKPLYLCAPTAKNGANPRDRTTHYLCYEDEGVKPVGKKARIINQLTKETGIELAVEKPVMLCVPSLKKLL